MRRKKLPEEVTVGESSLWVDLSQIFSLFSLSSSLNMHSAT